jgi:hypothetical protein
MQGPRQASRRSTWTARGSRGDGPKPSRRHPSINLVIMIMPPQQIEMRLLQAASGKRGVGTEAARPLRVRLRRSSRCWIRTMSSVAAASTSPNSL